MKSNKSKIGLSMWLSIAILIFFTGLFLFKKNYEFLTYTITIGIIIYLIIFSDKVFNYSNFAKFGFSLWLFLHLAGGSLKIFGERLYDLIILDLIGDPFFILRYDQIVHAFCYFIITLFVYSIVEYISNDEKNKFLLGLITFLASIGIGSFNEIIEFGTVVFFGATGVGGYYNNAIDLVFNSLGAFIAILVLNYKSKHS